LGWWQVNADTLAGSRFVLSPYAETFACLKLLHAGVAAHPGERAWLAAHLPAYRARLAADPVTALLVGAGLGREWIADFLTPTPRDGETFEEALAQVRSAAPADVRAHLRLSLAGPLPAALRDRTDLAERAAGLLEYVWTRAVRPYWPRRRHVLEADVLARTTQVGREGWAAVLGTLRPGTRWLGGNRFQVNLQEYPPREVSGAELVLVPVTPQRHGWVSWDPAGSRYALVYPCAGVLADPGGARADRGLGPLLGRNRAALLVLLGSPLTTTQLTAVTGQSLGSVGRHLKVLREAGLVTRRRAGRAVLYARTAAGDVLVGAGTAGQAGRGEPGGAGAAGQAGRGEPGGADTTGASIRP
jgi:DNA-binding transcriptional ArsR family regulator